jgi:MFS family permease
MTAAHNFRGLLATRFVLGAFEASVAPSFVAVTQMWWRRREQTVRISYWYAMNGITNMVGYFATSVDCNNLKLRSVLSSGA